jgi:hypothetical protein
MVTGSKGREIILWDLNLKAKSNLLSIFDDEHEKEIEVV